MPEDPKMAPTTVVETEADKAQNRKKFLVEEIGKILKEYGGLESNIPIGQQTNYWTYQNELRGLMVKY